jgi:hypothetical protein
MDELDNLAVKVARRFLARREAEGQQVRVEQQNSRVFSDLVALARESLTTDSERMSRELGANRTTVWMAH